MIRYAIHTLGRGWWTGCGWTTHSVHAQCLPGLGEAMHKEQRMHRDGLPSKVYDNSDGIDKHQENYEFKIAAD